MIKLGKLKKKVLIIAVVITIITAIIGSLCFFGFVWPNNLFANNYSVQGIDVSNYQGDINWTQVADNNKIKFAYIKATEGNDYQDKYFNKNWNEISKTSIYKGAYHYFTTKSTGKEQSYNFINTVPAEKGCLPPVVDVEEQGNDKAEFINELTDYLNIIESKYHQKPIIYPVYSLYDEYIRDSFKGYDIWIRDIIKPAKLIDNREWLMWQYCSRGRIQGIDMYVDINVYKKDIDDLELILSN